MFVIILMILLNFLMTFGADGTVDGYGHLGGAITGLIWGMAFFPRERTDAGNKIRTVGMACTGIWFSVMIICFFTVVDPIPQ